MPKMPSCQMLLTLRKMMTEKTEEVYLFCYSEEVAAAVGD